LSAPVFAAYMNPMPAPPITELNDRARDIFRVVVVPQPTGKTLAMPVSAGIEYAPVR